jgi:DNA-binding HxlR family transcriptional regulator
MQPVHDASLCPRYHHAIELIGRRWSGAILMVMRGGVVRFSDLAAAIPGLSDRMLSERLKELEAEQLVERRVIPETPVKVEYRLTARGEALGSVLDAVTAWAHDWLGEDMVTDAAGTSNRPPDGDAAASGARRQRRRHARSAPQPA